MLYLIGLGLNDEKDLSLRTIEILKESDKIYFENYTSANRIDINKLEKLINKKIELKDRDFIENHSDTIIEESKTKNIAILVIGHPLIATTHSLFLNENTKVIHNYSILDAVSITGLEVYKFGRIVSIPFHEASSFYDYIVKNKKINLHTLCLLDLKKDKSIFMSINEALIKIKKHDYENIIDEVIGCCALATDEEEIYYGKYDDIMKIDFSKKPKPQCLIIPGSLNPFEKEQINRFKIKTYK